MLNLFFTNTKPAESSKSFLWEERAKNRVMCIHWHFPCWVQHNRQCVSVINTKRSLIFYGSLGRLILQSVQCYKTRDCDIDFLEEDLTSYYTNNVARRKNGWHKIPVIRRAPVKMEDNLDDKCFGATVKVPECLSVCWSAPSITSRGTIWFGHTLFVIGSSCLICICIRKSTTVALSFNNNMCYLKRARTQF